MNLTLIILRRGKIGCESSIDHYRNICKNATFSVQFIEKLVMKME